MGFDHGDGMLIKIVKYLVLPPYKAVRVTDSTTQLMPNQPWISAGGDHNRFVLCDLMHIWMVNSDISYQLVPRTWKVFVGLYTELDQVTYQLSWGSVMVMPK